MAGFEREREGTPLEIPSYDLPPGRYEMSEIAAVLAIKKRFKC